MKKDPTSSDQPVEDRMVTDFHGFCFNAKKGSEKIAWFQ